MNSEDTDRCPGCGIVAPSDGGPTHAYLGSSAGCWRRYGEILAREFQEPEWFASHQITVDAYAAQHPGVPERRSAQSVALHLTTLGLIFERDFDPADAPKLHKRMAHRPDYSWLEPPSMEGTSTVLDVLGARDPDEHERLFRRWGREIWDAWGDHRETLWRWLDAALGSESRA